nr:DUF4249 family protein [Pedobacter sp. ASV2]
MKKSIFYIAIVISVIIASLALTSCKKHISIPIPAGTNKPVLNSLIRAGKKIEARVTISKWIREGEMFSAIPGTKVYLYENGVVKETLDTVTVSGKMRFLSRTRAVTGKTYRLIADIPGYDRLEGQDIIPDINDIEITNQVQTEISSTDGGQHRFDFTIANKGKSILYYRIRILNDFDSFTGKKLEKPEPLSIYNNKVTQPLDYKDLYAQWLEVNPQPGGSSITYSFSTTVKPRGLSLLEISILTPTSFKYLLSSEKALEHKDDFTSEKVIISSNVAGGYGIVGGLSTTSF